MATKVVSIISRMNVGGPAYLLAELINNSPSTFEHTLITGACGSEEIDFLDSNHINASVYYLRNLKRKVGIASDLSGFFGLILLLRKIKPDIVHTHTSKAGFIGRLAAVIACPKSVRIHTFHGHLLYGYFPKSFTSLVVLAERCLARITRCLIAVSKQVRSDLLAKGVGRSTNWKVIYPGIETASAQVRRNLRLNEYSFTNPLRILWIGRFAPIKDPEFAIRALSLLPQELKNRLELTMVGAGDLLEICKDAAKRSGCSVQFTGWQRNVDRYLDECDLIISTSRNEGLPIVMLEAGSRGIPILSTNVGGVDEIVMTGHNGWLTSRNLIDFVEAINFILTNGIPFEYPNNSYNVIVKKFSLAKYLDSHYDLYSDLAVKPSQI